jgi:hypothetical protein
LWSYSTSFQGKRITHSFLRAFPGLAATLGQDTFTADARGFAGALSPVLFGYAFLTGLGPVEITLASVVVKAVTPDTARFADAIVKDASGDA